MQRTIRPDPKIPDHEVLRKIGGGSYGEVWLARAVTGVLRAVKIIYREDFSDARTFEREFDGILKFEPISRDHPAFVNILHVGRGNIESPFYYYVMELGDDAFSGKEINPVEYEPRTLRTDVKNADGEPLDTDFCIEAGRKLASGLAELHERGLTHRDVKPSNVIFVDGGPKLADIGLVASKGQRTFVGTEGFVPPEGPGSEEADVYGLGKVLYEMATGMDRLQFPELPLKTIREGDRKKWLRLNRLICDVCDSRLSKRKISTGRELAEALERLQEGKAVSTKVPVSVKLAFLGVVLLSLIGGHLWWEKTAGTYVIEGKGEPLPVQYVSVKIISDPEGARVYNSEGDFLDVTPATLGEVAVGSDLNLRLSASGYRDDWIDSAVSDDQDGTRVMLIFRKLSLFSPPRPGEKWTDALGNLYEPLGRLRHESDLHIGPREWREFRKEVSGIPTAVTLDHQGVDIVLVSPSLAQRFAVWLLEKCIREGYFEEYDDLEREEHREIVGEIDIGFPKGRLPRDPENAGERLRPFRTVVRPIPYVSINISSLPSGASLYLNDELVGETPWQGFVRPGLLNLTLELGGYQTEAESVPLTDGANFSKEFMLERNKSLVLGQPWTNSLGMEFAPFGEEKMAAVTEVQAQHYREYLNSSQARRGEVLVSREGTFPVTNVTLEECRAFCEWLTEWERGERIPKSYEYRLPTDEEWSELVGIEEDGSSPADREQEKKNEGFYPWGGDWPPPARSGNYADLSARSLLADGAVIDGYEDGFSLVAPVKQFAKNRLGLYDLGGNVQEWVESDYKGLGILRGGSYTSFTRSHLESRFRYPVDAGNRGETFGFRVLLAPAARAGN